jgi:hypothetical protein
VATGSWPVPGTSPAGAGRPDATATVVSQKLRPVPASAPKRARRFAAAAGAVLLLATGGWWLVASRAPRPVAGALVVEEPVGLLGRLLGHQARLLVTVREETPLRLALETPLNSQNASAGEAITAEMTSAVRVEGVEALPAGSRLAGRVTRAASAGQAGGRGELTLEFDTVTLPDGSRFDLRTRPLAIKAPAPARKKENAIVTGLSEVGAAVGGLLGGRRGERTGGVVGGAAGAVYFSGDEGREVTLPARASLSVETAETTTIVRPRRP